MNRLFIIIITGCSLIFAFRARGNEADADLASQLVRMAADPDPRVRMQLAFTLGEVNSTERIAALTTVALRDCSDPWIRAAVLSSVGDKALGLFMSITRSLGASSSSDAVSNDMGIVYGQLARMIGTRLDKDQIAQLIDQVASLPAQIPAEGKRVPIQAAALSGLLEGIRLAEGKNLSIARAEAPLKELIASPSAKVRLPAGHLASLLLDSTHESDDRQRVALIEKALNETLTEAQRTEAIRSINGIEWNADFARLAQLLDPRESDAIQIAVLDKINQVRDPAVGSVVVDNWAGFGPEIRRKALDVIFNQKERIGLLLDAVSDDKIHASQIDTNRHAMLFSFPDKQIAEKAKSLFDARRQGQDASLFEKYKAALDLKGKAANGSAIHKQRCAQCHKVGEIGYDVGPSWGGVKSNPPEKILGNILYPNQSIAPGFTNYVIEMKDGRVATGIIVSSSSASITLRRGLGEEETVLRRNIGSVTDTALSLMPEGLEDGLSTQDMADLLAFIQEAH